MPPRPPHPGRPRRPRRARGDDLTALVAVAISQEERAVAVEAIACVGSGNTVRIGAGRARRAYEIAEILGLVAAELGAEVQISAQHDRVDVAPAGALAAAQVALVGLPHFARV